MMIITMGTTLWRSNIQTWADSLYDDLPSVRKVIFEPESTKIVAELYNVSALVEKFIGRIANARELCHRQMRLHERMLISRHDISRIEGLVQAWLNIQRIELRSGCGQEVRRNLWDLWHYNNIDKIHFGSTSLSAETWQWCMSHDTFFNWVGAFFLEGTVMSFFHDGEYLDALSFVEEFRTTQFGYKNVSAAETVVLALIHQGNYLEALRRSVGFSEEMDVSVKCLFHYYNAKILYKLGDVDSALSQIISVGVNLSGYILNDKISTFYLCLLISVSKFVCILQKNEFAYQLANLAAAASRNVGDEVFLIEAATLRAECCGGDEKLDCEGFVQRLRRDTAYRHLSLDGGVRYRETNTTGRPHEGRLFAELSAALESVT
jgi:hypothetical protein